MYAKRAGAPASRDTNMLKVENPYFDAQSKLPTNTTNLMPAQLQKRGKGGHKGFGAPSAPKGKGKGSLMTRPHSDGFLQDMMTPMGLHNMSDVQQYRKLVEMRNQDIMSKREDEILRQYQHVTQGITSQRARERIQTATGAARARLPADATDMERRIHRAVQQTTKRGKRELEVAGAAVSGKPFVPRRGGRGGFVTAGGELTGARPDGSAIFRHPRRGKGKGKGRGPADEDSE